MRQFPSTPSCAVSRFAPIRTAPPFLAVLLLIGLIAAQVLLSPVSAAQAQPNDQGEKLYQTPADLGDGAKPPEPIAVSWAVGDLDSGEVHAGHALDKRHAPASTIKLLSALALVEVLDDPKQKVRAEFEDMEIDGTKVGIMQTNDYTVDDLFHAMLMSSANDAANALGRAAGGQDKAVELMNEKAAELGMNGTHATDTSGLDDEHQYTTAADMMKLAWAVCENDYLMDVIGTETYSFPGGRNPDTKEKFKGYEIQNHTKIVGEVDGGLGLKNGYTKAAKGAYIAVAERNGKRVVSTVLGAENNSRQAAVDLLEWDFAQTAPETIATVDVGVLRSAEPTEGTAAAQALGSQGTAEAAAADAGVSGSDEVSEEAASPVVSPGLYVPIGLLAAGLVLLAVTALVWHRVRKNRQWP